MNLLEKNYNFAQIIHTSAERNPAKVALITNKTMLTYNELKDRVNKSGNLFLSIGIQAGDRVSLLFPNDYRFLEICFGLMAIGAIPVPMNAKLGPKALAYIAKDSGSKALIYHYTFKDKVQSVQTHTHVDHYVIVDDLYDEKVNKQSATLSIFQATTDDLCFLPYTSGSTGNPKGCMLTHSGQYWNVQSTAEVRNQSSQDRILIAVPLYHKNAMAEMKRIFYLGASAVILPQVDAHAILHAIHEHNCTFITGVPAMYRLLVNHLRDHSNYNLSSLRFVLCGSSDAPSELLDEIYERMGAQVYEGYGLTEGGPIVLSSRKGKTRLGSAGLPVPGCSIRIVNDEGLPVDLGETGELWVKNPGVAKGYWNLPELSKERITKDGWLKTGDSVREDKDGFVYILGRKDDMINIGGESVYPKEIENIILQNQKVKDVCVLPMNDQLKGQVPVAFIVSNESLSEDEVKKHFIENGPAYAHPRHVFFLNHLPLTGPGKVDRTSLQNKLQTILERKL